MDKTTAEQQRDALLRRLHRLPNLMRGTVYERLRKCGRASCTCALGGPKHTTRQLVVNLDGRTHTRYVRTGDVEKVRALIAAYEELWEIVTELTAVNLELLRGEHPGGCPETEARLMQGILPFVLEVDERPDAVTGRAGLPLVVETMRALKLDEVISQELRLRGRNNGYSETEKIEALALLMARGGECVDDIRVLQADRG